jgi:hypothetical protein
MKSSAGQMDGTPDSMILPLSHVALNNVSSCLGKNEKNKNFLIMMNLKDCPL